MLTFLKWYSIILIIIFLVTGLKSQLDEEVPKGYFILIFVALSPILFYLFTT